MSGCICSSCKNLKSIFDDEGAEVDCECVYGYPSEGCADCEAGECELACVNYISDEEPETPVILKCSSCGRELVQVCGNSEEGRVQCVECYLKGGL